MFSSRRPATRAGRTRLFLEALEERAVPTLLGQQLFPADNPWNQSVANAPVAADSNAVINNIISQYGDGRLHPDFGQDGQNGNALYGIPYNVVHGNSVAKVQVVVGAYAGESDLVPVPLPGNVVLEGDLQNGPTVGLDNRGDSHLLVWDEDNDVAYEFYRASRPGENGDGRWHADQETVWDMKTDAFRTLGDTSADAAGLSLLAGLVRPDEGLTVAQGGQGAIDHAIRFTLQNNVILDQFLYPASHEANPGNSNAAVQPPMGARFRLKAGVDISTLNPESQIIARAMQTYGLILADSGSNFYISGASYGVDGNNAFASTWDDNDIQDTVHGLKSLDFSDFEVVDLTPVVTGLSTHSGPAGAAVTVTGQNFSGAAGHLQVFFGNTAAAVTVLDDGHVRAVVPQGTGVVDVRVQSGVTTAADSQNVLNTIFGYGVSAVSAGDRFTFGVNQPPTVASPAAAGPNPVVGGTTRLQVLGADDGGESNLTYTWTSGGPATVVFSANGSNAAKTAVATFTQSGTYVLTATITDAGGLSVASSVQVNVTLPPTALYADFAGQGLYRWSGAAGWRLMNPVDPRELAVGPDGSLFADYGVYGLYRWTSAGGWQLLKQADATALAVGPDGYLYADFGGQGLSRWSSAGGWQAMSQANAGALADGPDGWLYVDFPGAGLYDWSAAAGWTRLSAADPESLAASPDGSLFANYGADGLYHWSGAGGWQRLSQANAAALTVAPDGSLYASFGAQGLYRWTAAGGWQLLSAVGPQALTAGPDGSLYLDYGLYGLYRWTNSGGWQLLNGLDPDALAAGVLA